MIDQEVSIIMPSYNSKRFVNICLRSVLSTNHPSFEVTFIDDGSIDGSLEYVKKEFGHDGKFKIICNERKLGLIVSRNVGIRTYSLQDMENCSL